MALKDWEKKTLGAPGARERVAAIEKELRLAARLTSLREEAGLSQRELARRIGISQPRVAAIEQARNVTLSVLYQYVNAVGGNLEVTVRKGSHSFPLTAKTPKHASTRTTKAESRAGVARKKRATTTAPKDRKAARSA